MAIETDLTIDLNGDIRHDTGSTNYTVLEFHRYLQAHADDEQMTGDDLLDITSSDPSDRSTDNIITLNSPYNIDDTLAEYLYDGSITQDDGDVVYSGLTVVGTVESGTELILIRDNEIITSWWSTGINDDAANNIISRMLIRSRGGIIHTDKDMAGLDIDSKKLTVMAREFNDKYAEFQLTLGLGSSTAAIFTVPDLNNTTGVGSFPLSTPPVNDNEGYNLINLNNGNGDQPYFSKWDKTIHTINELYETTKYYGRRGTGESTYGLSGALFRGITHEWGYDNETGALTQSEDLVWGTVIDYSAETGAFTVGERINFVGTGAVGQLLYEDETADFLVIYLDPNSATPLATDTIIGAASTETADVDTVTDGTAAGGSGLMLADDGTDTVWIQLLTGSPPTDPQFVFGTTSTESNQVNGSVTSRTVNAEFFGQSTGISIIGAFGVGVEAADLVQADSITTLLNTPQSPPNNQQFDVTGLVSAEDRVLVAKNDGSNNMDYDQYSLQTTLNTGSHTTIVVTGAVEGMTPQTGWLRVQLDLNKSGDDGIYRIITYSAWSTNGNTSFTVPDESWTDPDDATSGNNVFVGLIDKIAGATTESFTGVYSGDVSLLGRVRDGGGTPTKPVDYVTTFTSGGGGFGAIRVPDT